MLDCDNIADIDESVVEYLKSLESPTIHRNLSDVYYQCDKRSRPANTIRDTYTLYWIIYIISIWTKCSQYISVEIPD
jgi:hypothetical protein